MKRIELTEERFAGSFGGTTPRVQFDTPEVNSLNVSTVGMRRDMQSMRAQMEDLKSSVLEGLHGTISRTNAVDMP